MRDIIRVTIKSESGYGCIDDAYSEKITITPSSVSYEYKPAIESEFHAFRKWSYKTNSSLFLELFMKISSMMDKMLHPCPPVDDWGKKRQTRPQKYKD